MKELFNNLRHVSSLYGAVRFYSFEDRINSASSSSSQELLLIGWRVWTCEWGHTHTHTHTRSVRSAARRVVCVLEARVVDMWMWSHADGACAALFSHGASLHSGQFMIHTHTHTQSKHW